MTGPEASSERDDSIFDEPFVEINGCPITVDVEPVFDQFYILNDEYSLLGSAAAS
jgi:hypothetical protein